ncbi:hypothetical protein B0H13DRAFT_2322520 [Mycena leptocephala]|nr:hypothetical protein B0H13DRAFT_2322520 [Mycena leptocephala]
MLNGTSPIIGGNSIGRVCAFPVTRAGLTHFALPSRLWGGVHAFPLSPMLVSLTLPHLLVSREEWLVCAFALLLMLVSLALLAFSSLASACFSSVGHAFLARLSRLLVSREWTVGAFPPFPMLVSLTLLAFSFLVESLCLAFSSLDWSVYFFSVAHAGLAHFASPSRL